MDTNPELFRELLLPRRAHAIIAAYEALTEPEVRAAALAVLQNPVFRWVLVDLQDQVVQALRLPLSKEAREREGLMLAAIDLLLGAFIGQAFATRNSPDS